MRDQPVYVFFSKPSASSVSITTSASLNPDGLKTQIPEVAIDVIEHQKFENEA